MTATKLTQDKNEILLESSLPALSSLREMMTGSISQQEQGLRRRSEQGDLPPSPFLSTSLYAGDDPCCYRTSDSTNCSNSSIYADDSSCNDHTEVSMNNDSCCTAPLNDKSGGLSIYNLMHELQINEQTYGYTSLEVASTYNAIGLFHCRIYKDYNGALQYHTKALRIIKTLQEQQHQQQAAHVHETSVDSFTSATSIAARKHESPLRIIPLLVTTYMDIGTCYELQQNYKMAIQYYEMTDDTIIRLEQQAKNSVGSKSKRIIPRHITFACRRAIARVKRL